MPQSSSLIPSVIALSVPAVAAAVVTALRPRLRPDRIRTRRLTFAVGLTILGQALHFTEELATKLYEALPAAFGYPVASESAFVWINGVALALWVAALLAVRNGIVIALLPLWFLGFAMVLNLVAHPYLALRAGGYFPGVLTAPIVGALGIFMLRELARVTEPERKAGGARG